jgi:hypothetical protein
VFTTNDLELALISEAVELSGRHEHLSCALLVRSNGIAQLTDSCLETHAWQATQAIRLCSMGTLRGSCKGLTINNIDGKW